MRYVSAQFLDALERLLQICQRGDFRAGSNRAAGFNVIAVVGSEEKRAFALAHGANFAINRATEDRIAKVMEITGGRGVDLMLDHMVDLISETISK